jgi:sulfur-oxidizing protein SoxY
MTGADRVSYRDEVWPTPDQRTGLMVDRRHDPTATRRQFLTVAGGVIGCVAVAPALTVRPAAATPAATAAAIGAVVGEAPVHQGNVKLEVPPLVENGNAVPLTVSVDSPMTEREHVKSIHIFNEKNPQPYVASFHLGPRAGRAQVSTRIRLADSQKVIAIAQLSDDSLWSDSVEVMVTLAACLEDFQK